MTACQTTLINQPRQTVAAADGLIERSVTAGLPCFTIGGTRCLTFILPT